MCLYKGISFPLDYNKVYCRRRRRRCSALIFPCECGLAPLFRAGCVRRGEQGAHKGALHGEIGNLLSENVFECHAYVGGAIAP